VAAEPGLNLPGANLGMVRFLYHEPKAEAHGCAELLKQGLVQFWLDSFEITADNNKEK